MLSLIEKAAKPEAEEKKESNGSTATWTLEMGAPTAKQASHPSVVCNFHIVCHIKDVLMAEFSWMQVMRLREGQKHDKVFTAKTLIYHGHYVRTNDNIKLHRGLQYYILKKAVKMASEGGFPNHYMERLSDEDVRPIPTKS